MCVPVVNSTLAHVTIPASNARTPVMCIAISYEDVTHHYVGLIETTDSMVYEDGCRNEPYRVSYELTMDTNLMVAES